MTRILYVRPMCMYTPHSQSDGRPYSAASRPECRRVPSAETL